MPKTKFNKKLKCCMCQKRTFSFSIMVRYVLNIAPFPDHDGQEDADDDHQHDHAQDDVHALGIVI